MAFNSTSERYQYIYGSSVRKVEEVNPAPAKKTASAIPAPDPDRLDRSRVVRRPRRNRPVDHSQVVPVEIEEKRGGKLVAFDWKYTLIVSLAILLVVSEAIYYVRGTAHIHDLNTQITELKEEKEALTSKKEALSAAVNNTVNLNDVGIYAKDTLHMTYPDNEHTIRYYDDGGDYFKQY